MRKISTISSVIEANWACLESLISHDAETASLMELLTWVLRRGIVRRHIDRIAITWLLRGRTSIDLA